HEDAGGGKIENQEAQQRADEEREHDGDEELPRLGHGQHSEKKRAAANGRHTGGETVHVVQKIEGVGDAGNPEDGENDGGPFTCAEVVEDGEGAQIGEEDEGGDD